MSQALSETRYKMDRALDSHVRQSNDEHIASMYFLKILKEN